MNKVIRKHTRHSISPQRLGRYSVLPPCWTSWRVCCSPWLWRCPSVWELECSEKTTDTLSLVWRYTPAFNYTLYTLVFLCTLMLLRLTSVKELSLLFILCRVSSTLVGFGGSSNTGFIFSPLITSRTHTQADIKVLILLGYWNEQIYLCDCTYCCNPLYFHFHHMSECWWPACEHPGSLQESKPQTE